MGVTPSKEDRGHWWVESILQGHNPKDKACVDLDFNGNFKLRKCQMNIGLRKKIKQSDVITIPWNSACKKIDSSELKGLVNGSRIFWVKANIAESGTIKWVGRIRGQLFAGLEMDNKVKVSVEGYSGKGLFKCKKRQGRAVVLLNQVVPEKEFIYRDRSRNASFSSQGTLTTMSETPSVGYQTYVRCLPVDSPSPINWDDDLSISSNQIKSDQLLPEGWDKGDRVYFPAKTCFATIISRRFNGSEEEFVVEYDEKIGDPDFLPSTKLLFKEGHARVISLEKLITCALVVNPKIGNSKICNSLDVLPECNNNIWSSTNNMVEDFNIRNDLRNCTSSELSAPKISAEQEFMINQNYKELPRQAQAKPSVSNYVVADQKEKQKDADVVRGEENLVTKLSNSESSQKIEGGIHLLLLNNYPRILNEPDPTFWGESGCSFNVKSNDNDSKAYAGKYSRPGRSLRTTENCKSPAYWGESVMTNGKGIRQQYEENWQTLRRNPVKHPTALTLNHRQTNQYVMHDIGLPGLCQMSSDSRDVFLQLPKPVDDIFIQENQGAVIGVQGEKGYSFVDSTLIAMFFATRAFDDVLLNREASDPIELKNLKFYLRNQIIVKLRTAVLVSSLNVAEFIKQLVFFKHNIATTPMDVVVFIRFLLENVFQVPHFIYYSNAGLSGHIHDIRSDYFESSIGGVSVQALFEFSMASQDLKLQLVPLPALIIKLPRWKEKTDNFPVVIPSLQLDLVPVMLNAGRICSCNKSAEFVCALCADDAHGFCVSCLYQAELIHADSDHHFMSVISQPNPVVLDLIAVICVSRHRTTTFVKCGTTLLAPWLHFDSNVAEVTELPAMGQILISLEKELENGKFRRKDYHPLVNRILTNSCVCFYK